MVVLEFIVCFIYYYCLDPTGAGVGTPHDLTISQFWEGVRIHARSYDAAFRGPTRAHPLASDCCVFPPATEFWDNARGNLVISRCDNKIHLVLSWTRSRDCVQIASDKRMISVISVLKVSPGTGSSAAHVAERFREEPGGNIQQPPRPGMRIP